MPTEGLLDPGVRRWLFVVWALVLVIVAIGGVTRLTGSGLSIVEWQPVAGVLPPLSDADWQGLFAKYQDSPQFQQHNAWMALADFKRIFFWEYVHRLVGRLVGLAVLLPWLFFVLRGRMSRSLALRTAGVFALGAAQGALGWYMVQSGLVDEPRVSHFRLAAHLLLAFATGALVLWLALGERTAAASRQGAAARGCAVVLLVLLAAQTVYGAFMAGTHAGHYYATFPDMNGRYLPGSFFTGASWLSDALTNPSAIHYLHRLLGWLTLVYALALLVFHFCSAAGRALVRAAALVALLTFAQFNLGALTVVRRIELPFALAHQALAYLLVSAAVLLLHRTPRSGSDSG